MMKKFLPLIIIILAVIGLFAGFKFLNKKEEAKVASLPDPTAIEYYWGNGCPHCATVAEFVDSWEKPEGVNLEKYEVWYDQKNSARLTARAAGLCGIDSSDIGVPLLVTPEKQCFSGDEPIINYFKSLSSTPSNP